MVLIHPARTPTDPSTCLVRAASLLVPCQGRPCPSQLSPGRCIAPFTAQQRRGSRAAGGARRHKDLRSVSGMELVMEELVEVIVLMDGLIPYAG